MSHLASQYSLDVRDDVWMRPEFAQLPYTDGDAVERNLLDVITAAGDIGTLSVELSRAITDWPSRYHLSPARANLLRPFAEILRGRTLEVGAGCGALTRFLGELKGEVVAVEGSRNRARIAARRCRDLANVAVVCDRIETFEAGEAFDAVTLIGVLEYARVFGAGEDPVREILLACRQRLSPGGRLIVAIENQLGLKYFAGAVEDHALVAMHGINDTYDDRSVVTFGRSELESIIRSCGFEDIQFCVPLPDYKLPNTVVLPRGLSQDASVDVANLFSQAGFRDCQKPAFPLFSLEQAWRVVARNRLLVDLANSFLIVASPGRRESPLGASNRDVIARHYSTERRPEFCHEVVIAEGDGGLTVERTPLIEHPRDSLPIRITFGPAEYIPGEIWWDRLGVVLNRPGWAAPDLVSWAKPWASLLRDSAPGVGLESTLPNNYVDATPFNLVRDREGNFRFFDLEWSTIENPILGHVLFRGLYWSIATFTSVAKPCDPSHLKLKALIESVIQGLGFEVTEDDLRRYVELENRFRNWAAPDSAEIGLSDLGIAELAVRTPMESCADSARRATALAGMAESAQAVNDGLRSALEAQRVRADSMEDQLASLRQEHAAALARERSAAEQAAEFSRRAERQAQELVERKRGMESKIADLEAEVAAERGRMEGELTSLRREHAAALARERSAVEQAVESARRAERQAQELVERKRGMESKIADLEAEVAAERGRVAAHLLDAAALRNSISWRVTKPVRFIADAFLNMHQTVVRLVYNSPAFSWAGKALARGVYAWPIPGGRLLLPSVPLFSPEYYSASHPDVGKESNLWAHYIGFGADEGRNPHPLFDTRFYLATNRDVALSGLNPLIHYWTYGAAEGRRPHPDFDPCSYLARRPDVRQSGVNPLLHYWEHGRMRIRRPRLSSDCWPSRPRSSRGNRAMGRSFPCFSPPSIRLPICFGRPSIRCAAKPARGGSSAFKTTDLPARTRSLRSSNTRP